MKKIEAAAHALMEKYGTSSPFALCDSLKISVVSLELPEKTGGFCFQLQQGGFVIVLNNARRPSECAFCCAHELGHVLLHKGLNEQTMADLTNLCTQKLENEADFFAACLFIDPHLADWHERFDPLTVAQVAALSGLSERVVRLRFRERMAQISTC